MSVQDLPTLNAFLNATSAVLLLAGYIAIRSGKRDVHRALMGAALATSAAFLTSYLVYHFQVGSVKFQGVGAIRTVYFTILISHTILAVFVPPLAVTTAYLAIKGRFEQHKRIARFALPIWGYVSVTGVAVYWMLYELQY